MRLSRDKSILLLLALLTIGVFARVAVNDFVNYDDPDYVTNNPHVQAGLTWQGVVWAFTTDHANEREIIPTVARVVLEEFAH